MISMTSSHLYFLAIHLIHSDYLVYYLSIQMRITHNNIFIVMRIITTIIYYQIHFCINSNPGIIIINRNLQHVFLFIFHYMILMMDCFVQMSLHDFMISRKSINSRIWIWILRRRRNDSLKRRLTIF